MYGHRRFLAVLALAVPLAAAPPALAAGQARHHHHHARHGAHAHVVRRLSFNARVVRSDRHGLVVRTARGRLLHFNQRQLHATRAAARHVRHAADGSSANTSISAGSVVINLIGLQPGSQVTITETVLSDGSITITITLPSTPPSGQTASGVVTDVSDDSFRLDSSDGSSLVFHLAADQLSALGLKPCDQASVAYHQDGGLLIADHVTPAGASTTGDCAPTGDSTGTISAISDHSVTIDTDGGPVTLAVTDPSQLDGFAVGDVVDASYVETDGAQTLTSLCYHESEASGTVTSVTNEVHGGSLTLTNDADGSPLTVIADPDRGVQINSHAFSGVAPGDAVSVSYHQTAGGLVADTVSED